MKTIWHFVGFLSLGLFLTSCGDGGTISGESCGEDCAKKHMKEQNKCDLNYQNHDAELLDCYNHVHRQITVCNGKCLGNL